MSPLLTEFPGRAEHAWTLTGRRASVSGANHDIADVEIDGRLVAREMHLAVNGATPETVAVKVAPDEIVRVLQAGELQLTERITTALEHPLVFWSLVADGPADLRLAWHPVIGRRQEEQGSLAALGMTESMPGTIVLSGQDGSEPVAVVAAAGAVRVDGNRVMVEGDRILRVVLAAGPEAHDLDRALDALRRRKLRAFRQDRILHARRLEERLVSLESPDPVLDRRFGWAKVELDARLEERPGRGRCMSRETARTGRALLAAGDREVVRDLVRSLTLEDELDPALPALAAAWLRWTGDLDAVSRSWERLADVVEAMPDRVATAVRDGLSAGAHAAGEQAIAARLEAVRVSGGEAPHPHIELTGYGAEPAGLVSGIVETLWGVDPDLIRGEVRVVAGLPRGWSEMALRRLRVGPTFFDLRLRRRPERTVLAVRRVSGPPLRLKASLRDDAARGPVTIDQVELGGREATFLVEDVHEVAFHDG
ncbi:MAG: hypothetical protein U0133_15965 [Gemmatimonadales bacterium]